MPLIISREKQTLIRAVKAWQPLGFHSNESWRLGPAASIWAPSLRQSLSKNGREVWFCVSLTRSQLSTSKSNLASKDGAMSLASLLEASSEERPWNRTEEGQRRRWPSASLNKQAVDKVQRDCFVLVVRSNDIFPNKTTKDVGWLTVYLAHQLHWQRLPLLYKWSSLSASGSNDWLQIRLLMARNREKLNIDRRTAWRTAGMRDGWQDGRTSGRSEGRTNEVRLSRNKQSHVS